MKHITLQSVAPLARRAHPRSGTTPRRGAVLVITLFAVILIAAMLAYVVNLGRQANSRIVTQNAADATAISGAGWYARTLNTVAMNNVSMARLVALVNVLDGLPQAVDFTLKDQQAIYDAVNDQINGTNGRNGIADSWMRHAITGSGLPAGTRLSRRTNFRPFFDEITTEVDLLKPVDQALNHSAFDMKTLTFYNAPGGRGQIWLAMESLDTLNQTMVDNVSILSQTNAELAGLSDTAQTGDVNTTRILGINSGAAFLLPGEVSIPVTHGSFDDFNRPVTHGLLPVGIDDKTTNRGPYDTIFGWRTAVGGDVVGGYWVPTTGTVATGGHGSVPVGVGRGASSSGHWEGGTRNPDAYTVYGPHGWLLRQLSGIQRDQLRHSRFGGWSSQMSSIKLRYLWPGGDIQQLVDPNWITDLATIYRTGDDQRSTIVETCFVAVEIKSKYPRNDSRFLSPGSFSLDEPNGSWTPRVVRTPGWVDPRRWSATQTNQAIWRDEWSYAVLFDSDIGITQIYDPVTHQVVPQPVYRIDEFLLVGVNVGTRVDIRSPHNFTSRADLPAPINADPTKLTNDAAGRRNYLTFLGLSAKYDRLLMWPSRFGGGKSEAANFAIAQAKVFNDHSWDLWTQMWRVQLEPVSDFAEWNTRLETAAAAPPEGMLINADALEMLRKYMKSVESLAPVMLNH